MPAERFDVIFRGESLAGQNPAMVRSLVGHLVKASEAQLERLFSGYPFTLKKAVDWETAERFRLAFLKTGALVEIRSYFDSPSEAIADSSQSKPEPTFGFGLAPPNTGTLEDCAVPQASPPILDITNLTLATPGAKLDRTPAPPAVAIDTHTLSLVPGQSWSLEDCQPGMRPLSIPNTEKLALSAPGAILDETAPLPPPRIDISTLDVVMEQGWTLKDCQPLPPPELVVDLSNLKLGV